MFYVLYESSELLSGAVIKRQCDINSLRLINWHSMALLFYRSPSIFLVNFYKYGNNKRAIPSVCDVPGSSLILEAVKQYAQSVQLLSGSHFIKSTQIGQKSHTIMLHLYIY